MWNPGLQMMRGFRDEWRRLGQLPALPVVSAFFALALLAALVLDDSAATGVGVVLLAALVLYCFARPRGGWEVFGSAAVPGASSTLLHDIAGTPRWIGLLLIPIALFLAWDEDRDTQERGAGAS